MMSLISTLLIVGLMSFNMKNTSRCRPMSNICIFFFIIYPRGKFLTIGQLWMYSISSLSCLFCHYFPSILYTSLHHPLSIVFLFSAYTKDEVCVQLSCYTSLIQNNQIFYQLSTLSTHPKSVSNGVRL